MGKGQTPLAVSTIIAVKTRMMIWLVMLVTAGCAGPALKQGFGSIDPQERTAALIDAARHNDQTAIPELIELLESADPAERMLASEALRRLTGKNLGYRHSDAVWRRRESIEGWRRWWDERTRKEVEGGTTPRAPMGKTP